MNIKQLGRLMGGLFLPFYFSYAMEITPVLDDEDNVPRQKKEDKLSTSFKHALKEQTTYGVIQWDDRFLVLRSEFFMEFVKQKKINPQFKNYTLPVFLKKFTPMVIWNNRKGEVRLVPYDAIVGVIKQTPRSAFFSYNNKATLLSDLFHEALGDNSSFLRRNKYIVVGAYDSSSSSSSLIERRLILLHDLHVPSWTYAKALLTSRELAKEREKLQTVPQSEHHK